MRIVLYLLLASAVHFGGDYRNPRTVSHNDCPTSGLDLALSAAPGIPARVFRRMQR
ncbi:hypothetical protein GCM10010207_00660 [Streptomyces atratus]|nr:hypothetical protein GCM10010207_00660 [Streptomyces atratus]